MQVGGTTARNAGLKLVVRRGGAKPGGSTGGSGNLGDMKEAGSEI